MATGREQPENCPRLWIISQEDIFFRSSHGRLKLRISSYEGTQLIYYNRPDTPGPKHSEYHIYEIEDPTALKRILELAYGLRGVVRKVRHLYMIGQARVLNNILIPLLDI